MTTLKYLEIEGFTLFKKRQFIDFTKFGEDAIIGVFGVNKDGAGGYDSNGSGKSNFLNAIDWVIFDKIPVQSSKETSIAKTDVVHWKSDKASVKLGILVDGTLIEMLNIRTKAGNKKFQLWINGIEFHSNTDTQKRNKLFSLLGIGGKNKMYYSDFLNNCHFTGDIEKSFASKNFSNEKRLEIVARYKKLEIFDISIDLVREDKAGQHKLLEQLKNKLAVYEDLGYDENINDQWLNIEIKNLTKVIENLNIKFDNVKNFIDKTKQYQEIQGEYNNNQYNKNSIEQTIDSNYLIIKKIFDRWVELNADRKSYETKILDAETVLMDYAKSDQIPLVLSLEIAVFNFYKNYEKDQNKLLSELSSQTYLINTKINSAKEEIESLNNQHFYSCPSCDAKLLFDTEAQGLIGCNPEQIEKALVSLNKIIDENKNLLVALNLQKEEIDEQLSQVGIILRDVEKNIQIIKSNKELLQKVLLKLDNTDYKELMEYVGPDGQLKPTLNQYNEYEDWVLADEKSKFLFEKLNKLKAELGDSIAYTEESLGDIKTQIAENNNLIIEANKRYAENIKLGEKISTTKNNIRDIENKLTLYDDWMSYFKQLKTIELLETKPILESVSNKILSDIGTNIKVEYLLDVDKNSLSLELEEDSGEVIPLELFSKGQSNRISFAAGLSLRALTEDEKSFNFGFTQWDEVLDGLDHTGQTLFFEVLKSLNGLKFCISHDSNIQNLFINKILVTRENGESNIKVLEV